MEHLGYKLHLLSILGNQIENNAKGKKRLCLDSLRCINDVAKAPKLGIESTQVAMHIVEQGELNVFI